MEKEMLKDIAEAILAKAPPAGWEVRIVAIDGHGGAGKSTLAVELAEELRAEVIHTDDFASWENPVDWWPTLIKKVLEPIRSGAKTLTYERSRWSPEHNPEPVRDQPVTPVMILEGVSSSRLEFRPYLSYAVWVETPRHICLERGIQRDGEKMRSQWEEWLAGEDEYIARDNPTDFADIVVSGS